MNDSAKRELLTGLFLMAKVLRQPPDLSEENGPGESLVAEIYATALGDRTPEAIQAAVQRTLSEPGRIFFPTPGELLEHLLSYQRAQLHAAPSRKALKETIRDPKTEADVQGLLSRLRAMIPEVPVTDRQRPVTELPTAEERERQRQRGQAEITKLEDWKREKGLA